MSQTKKRVRTAISGGPARSSTRRVAKKATTTAASKKTTALAVVAGHHKQPRVVKHANAIVKSFPGRTKRFLKSNPVRILLGASLVGFAIAKLKHVLA